MSLFIKKIIKNQTPCCTKCSSAKDATAKSVTYKGSISVKVLGSGCSKCKLLKAEASAALKQLNIAAEVESVTDFAQIAAYGVMSTPALVINEKIVAYGKPLKKQEIIDILKNTEVNL